MVFTESFKIRFPKFTSKRNVTAIPLILIPVNRTRPELFVGEVKCSAPITACAVDTVIKVIDSLLFIYFFLLCEEFLIWQTFKQMEDVMLIKSRGQFRCLELREVCA